jgi:hypothetical protein
MANVKLSFCGTTESDTDQHELQCYANLRGEMFIMIDMKDEMFQPSFICLDKETAIKLSRELRKQISYL